MLHFELGIQIQQGWQYIYSGLKAIEKIKYFHLYIPFFQQVLQAYFHSKMFSEKFLAFPLFLN